MSEFCEHETFKEICGICHRDARITALRAEIDRLTAENEKLREAGITMSRAADRHFESATQLHARVKELEEKQ